jgi:hypothetical protein
MFYQLMLSFKKQEGLLDGEAGEPTSKTTLWYMHS